MIIFIEIKLATPQLMKTPSYLAIPQENTFLCHNLGLNFISLYKYTIAKITSTKMNSYKFFTK